MSGARYAHPDGRPWIRALPPRKVGALIDLVRQGYVVTLFCDGCGRSVRLLPRQVAELVGRHGSSLPVRAFMDRLVCRNCEARWPWLDLRVSPYLVPGGGLTIPRQRQLEVRPLSKRPSSVV